MQFNNLMKTAKPALNEAKASMLFDRCMESCQSRPIGATFCTQKQQPDEINEQL